MPNHHTRGRSSREEGIAMITVMLVLMLMSALLVGFTTVVMSDQRYRFIDKDRGQAFYAASGGVEKLTADLGNLFLKNVAPTAAQVTALTATGMMPSITGISYTSSNPPQALPASQVTSYFCAGNKTVNGIFMAPRTPTVVGANGYTITFCALNSTGNPTTSDSPLPIKWGPYEGLIALQTPYQIDVTAKTATGGEVHLARTVEAVAIPVFQFGMFSDVDLSYFAEQNFGFGGRVHTNGNLWLAEGAGSTLTMTGKITAVGAVVRQYLSNGVAIGDIGMTGTISLATQANAPTGNRTLAATEGSVTGMPGSGAYSGWKALSTGAAPPNYNGYIKSGTTGAKPLKLPLTAAGVGGTNIDIIRRPAPGEDTTSILFGERLANKASLRIFLSDTSNDITSIPGIGPGAPIQLAGDWKTTPPFAGYASVPIARSMGNTGNLLTTAAATTQGTSTSLSFNPSGFGTTIFKKPTLLAAKNAAGTIIINLDCSGGGVTWSATQISGCTWSGSLASGYTVYVRGATPGAAYPGSMPGTIPTATLTGTIPSTGGTMTLSPNTLAFAPNSFFLTDDGSASATGISTPVTCLGSTATTFTNCTGLPTTSAGAHITTGYVTPQDTATIGGWIKIERGNTDGSWTDVTQEILGYGIADKDPPPAVGLSCPGGVGSGPGCSCNDPTPNAIIRLQRLRQTNNTATCSVADTTNSYEYWPQVLWDSREGIQRDDDPNTFCAGGTCTGSAVTASTAGLQINGAMYYVALDVKNLAKWFKASAAPYNVLSTGPSAKVDNTGQTVYFSDRRSNRNSVPAETGEYGWEDMVNPGVTDGVPDNVCQAGEDLNGNTTCELYGKTPTWDGAYSSVGPSGAPYSPTSKPNDRVRRNVLQTNRPIFFRRALKLINGGTIGSDATVANRLTGLTIVSENPVYVQGDYNATSTFLSTDLHAATAIIADAVSILSNNWTDNASFFQPYFYNKYPSAFGGANSGLGRMRSTNTYYRVAILGGKPPNFTKPSDVGAVSVFGTDGGAHNFLRMLEQDNGATNTVNYRGSMATLAYARQAIGTFKCCSGTAADGVVYSVPVRNFIFDTDFLNPALLPPNTPVFRDMNAVGFSQELRPGR